MSDLKQLFSAMWRDDRGLNTAELMGNAALAIAALVVIWGALQALGVDIVDWIRVELLGSLLLYLVVFFGAALVLAFWAIPAVLASLLPVRHRDLLRELRPALLMAVATSLPITAVPFIVQLAERLVK